MRAIILVILIVMSLPAWAGDIDMEAMKRPGGPLAPPEQVPPEWPKQLYGVNISEADSQLKAARDICAEHPYSETRDAQGNKIGEVNGDFAVKCREVDQQWVASGAKARYDEIYTRMRNDQLQQVKGAVEK